MARKNQGEFYSHNPEEPLHHEDAAALEAIRAEAASGFGALGNAFDALSKKDIAPKAADLEQTEKDRAKAALSKKRKKLAAKKETHVSDTTNDGGDISAPEVIASPTDVDTLPTPTSIATPEEAIIDTPANGNENDGEKKKKKNRRKRKEDHSDTSVRQPEKTIEKMSLDECLRFFDEKVFDEKDLDHALQELRTRKVQLFDNRGRRMQKEEIEHLVSDVRRRITDSEKAIQIKNFTAALQEQANQEDDVEQLDTLPVHEPHVEPVIQTEPEIKTSAPEPIKTKTFLSMNGTADISDPAQATAAVFSGSNTESLTQNSEVRSAEIFDHVPLTNQVEQKQEPEIEKEEEPVFIPDTSNETDTTSQDALIEAKKVFAEKIKATTNIADLRELLLSSEGIDTFVDNIPAHLTGAQLHMLLNHVRYGLDFITHVPEELGLRAHFQELLEKEGHEISEQPVDTRPELKFSQQEKVSPENIWERDNNNTFAYNEEQKLTFEIERAQSLDDLKEILLAHPGIEGTQKGDFYPSADLVHLINEVQNGKVYIEEITRRMGLRKKVYELLKEDGYEMAHEIDPVKASQDFQTAFLTAEMTERARKGEHVSLPEYVVGNTDTSNSEKIVPFKADNPANLHIVPKPEELKDKIVVFPTQKKSITERLLGRWTPKRWRSKQ